MAIMPANVPNFPSAPKQQHTDAHTHRHTDTHTHTDTDTHTDTHTHTDTDTHTQGKRCSPIHPKVGRFVFPRPATISQLPRNTTLTQPHTQSIRIPGFAAAVEKLCTLNAESTANMVWLLSTPISLQHFLPLSFFPSCSHFFHETVNSIPFFFFVCVCVCLSGFSLKVFSLLVCFTSFTMLEHFVSGCICGCGCVASRHMRPSTALSALQTSLWTHSD